MRKSWGLTQKILTGEKTIETRWYRHKTRPWGKIFAGDEIYFKDSGEPVTVKATVSKVEQFENLDENKISQLLQKYKKEDLGTEEISAEIMNYIKGKKYGIIVHLANPKKITPFNVNKSGYGLQAAWLVTDKIQNIMIPIALKN